MAETNRHYLALYRKYRPQTFDDVCGRDAIVRTLKNQINTGRIGHSYLFCGTRGTGKTTIAKIFARAVNCEHPVDGSPCGECASCRAIAEDASLNVVEMDAASHNGVDDIRGIIDQVAYSPTQGRYRVFIIDEVHMLSTAAFNALLKTLEEPPAYAIFILATTEPNKLPLTILSRCQRYDFGRLSVKTIADRLRYVAQKEGLKAEDKALRYIASAADGSMRDGLSLLDQCNAFSYGEGELTYDRTLEILGAVDTRVFSGMYRCIHKADVRGALKILDDILVGGRELVQFVTDYIGYLRNVMLLRASEETADSLDVSSDNLELIREDAQMSETEEIIREIEVFSRLTEQIRYSSNRRILTETAIIRLCEPSMNVSRDTEGEILSLQERVRVLEERLVEQEKLLQQGAFSGSYAGGNAGAVPASPGRARPSAGADDASGEGTAQNGTVPKRRPVLPDAIPEEVQQVARRWGSLVANIPPERHLMKIYLLGAKPTVDENGQLLIVFENYVYAVHFTGSSQEAQQYREYLENYISTAVGRHVHIGYKELDNGAKFSDNYVDIQKSVNMKIEQE